MPSNTQDRGSSAGDSSSDTRTAQSEQGDADAADRNSRVPSEGSASGSDETVDVASLRRENTRLRQQYQTLRQDQYRKTVVALLALGAAALVGAALFPPVRDVLVVLGAIGLFAAAVTRYLSPEQLIPVDIGTTAFEAHAANHAAIVDELGLQDATVYVPGEERPRLFVPEHRPYSVPSSAELRDTFVITDDEDERGVAFAPSGAGLFAEFDRSRDGPLGDEPATLALQSTDALVELFELVGTATPETDAEDGRLTVRIGDCRFGSATTFDTPVASFLGVTLASGLDTPVTTEITPETDTDFIVTCRWNPSAIE
jgi:hypothetical protein